MKHLIENNVYYIIDNEEVLLTIKLEDNQQITLSTKKEVYSGPISYISFDPDIYNFK